MQFRVLLLVVVALVALTGTAKAQAHKESNLPPKVLSAKSAYFDDRTGVASVADKTSAQLKKCGRFQMVKDRKQADLIILLSADPYKGGYIVYSGGQTGTVDKNGKIDADPVPNFNKLAPVRYAYLTVIDPKTGESLWSESHQWGGLLTGFNSVGEILVKKLEKQINKR